MKMRLVVPILAAALFLTGCGSSDQASTTSEQGVAEATATGSPGKQITAAQVEVGDFASGVEMLRSLVKDLKQQSEAGLIADAQTTFSQMLGVWAAIEADIREEKPDVHQVAGSMMAELQQLLQSNEPDVQAVVQLDYQLYQELRKLAGL